MASNRRRLAGRIERIHRREAAAGLGRNTDLLTGPIADRAERSSAAPFRFPAAPEHVLRATVKCALNSLAGLVSEVGAAAANTLVSYRCMRVTPAPNAEMGPEGFVLIRYAITLSGPNT